MVLSTKKNMMRMLSVQPDSIANLENKLIYGSMFTLFTA